MKHSHRFIRLCIVLLLLAGNLTAGPESAYTAAMRLLIAQLDTAETAPANLKIANAFARIAEAEKTKWLPYYYAAYSFVHSAYAEDNVNKIDPLCDQAEAMLEKVDALSPNNSETYCIRAMVALARISVNYMQRGLENLALSRQHLEKSIELDKSNPRAFLMMGQQAYRTPEGFGGSKKDALAYFEKSLSLYEKQPAETDKLGIDWGRSTAARMVEACRKHLAKN